MLNIVLPCKGVRKLFGRAAGVENPGWCLWNMDWKQLVRGKTFSGVKVSADVIMEKTKKLEDHSEDC